MTSMRARAIDVAAAAFREAGVRAPRTQASTAVDALLAAGLLHDPTPAPDCAFDAPDQLCLLKLCELRTKAEYEMRQGKARYLNGEAWSRIVKVAEARGASDDDEIGSVLGEDEIAELVDRGYIDPIAS